MTTIDDVPGLIRQLYGIVRRLEQLPGDRRFTPDGHLVGSIGEVIAAHDYGLELLPASAPTHDAVSGDGRQVQIKATQVKWVSLYDEPEHLIVLRLFKDGSHEEVYNGPGKLAFHNAGKPAKTSQRRISLSKLTQLMERVPVDQRLSPVRH